MRLRRTRNQKNRNLRPISTQQELRREARRRVKEAWEAIPMATLEDFTPNTWWNRFRLRLRLLLPLWTGVWDYTDDRRERNRRTALIIAAIFIITALGFLLLRTIALHFRAW